MSTVTTTRAINFLQLNTELGGSLVGVNNDGTTRTVTADVPQATLQAAVDAHVAVDEDGNRATLQQRAAAALDANRTYLALTGPTAAQTTAQVKTLTRECTALIRLLLNRLDSTD